MAHEGEPYSPAEEEGHGEWTLEVYPEIENGRSPPLRERPRQKDGLNQSPHQRVSEKIVSQRGRQGNSQYRPGRAQKAQVYHTAEDSLWKESHQGWQEEEPDQKRGRRPEAHPHKVQRSAGAAQKRTAEQKQEKTQWY